jgi:hypothetical protein
MTKYFLGALSVVLFSLVAVAVADDYRLEVLNLPVLQAPDRTLTFDMSLTSSFS